MVGVLRPVNRSGHLKAMLLEMFVVRVLDGQVTWNISDDQIFVENGQQIGCSRQSNGGPQGEGNRQGMPCLHRTSLAESSMAKSCQVRSCQSDRNRKRVVGGMEWTEHMSLMEKVTG